MTTGDVVLDVNPGERVALSNPGNASYRSIGVTIGDLETSRYPRQTATGYQYIVMSTVAPSDISSWTAVPILVTWEQVTVEPGAEFVEFRAEDPITFAYVEEGMVRRMVRTIGEAEPINAPSDGSEGMHLDWFLIGEGAEAVMYNESDEPAGIIALTARPVESQV